MCEFLPQPLLPSLHCLRNGLETFQGTAAAVSRRGLFCTEFLVKVRAQPP